jgi:hypothetical protein
MNQEFREKDWRSRGLEVKGKALENCEKFKYIEKNI